MTRDLLAALALAALAAPTLADDCEYYEPRSVDLELDGAARVRVEAAAGSLRIEGRDGLGQLRVRGEACAARESDLAEIELRTERRGDEIRIEVVIDDAGYGWGSRTRRLDLEIELPSDLALSVRDGSGEVDIRGVGPLEIEDGSGSIDIRDVRGDLRIEDGSGSIEVEDVAGSVWVDEDGSGSIDIRGVRDDVEIGRDGSGSITIVRVGGSVRIGSDGSGSIRVEQIAGDLRVLSDGSGGISYDDVGGRIDIP